MLKLRKCKKVNMKVEEEAVQVELFLSEKKFKHYAGGCKKL